MVEGDDAIEVVVIRLAIGPAAVRASAVLLSDAERQRASRFVFDRDAHRFTVARARLRQRSEEHTSELQSPCNLVCRLLLEKKKKNSYRTNTSNTTLDVAR